MAGNSYGTLFRLTTFGESHGEALGGIIDGCPAGIQIDLDAIQHEMQRRKPGQSSIVTQRKEEDEVQLLSGIFEGKTTGTPIGFIIPNTNNAYVRSIMCYYEAINNYIYSNYYNERYGEFLDPSNCIEIDSENSCQNVVYGINYEFTGFNTHNQQQIIQNSGISSSNNCN